MMANAVFEEVRNRSVSLIEQLVEVWQSSVEATHSFLTAQAILGIKEYVPQALAHVPILIIARSTADEPVGFMGIDGDTLEMFFVADGFRGRGIGKQLLRTGVDQYSVRRLAVNEHNPDARKFYERMGFVVAERKDLDEQGNSYPLLLMSLE